MCSLSRDGRLETTIVGARSKTGTSHIWKAAENEDVEIQKDKTEKRRWILR